MPLRQPKARSDLEFFDKEVEGVDVVMVHDPIRGTYFKLNPLQAAMLQKLDGVRSLDEMVEALSEQFEVEIPRHAAERFIAQARKMMLLDVASFNVSEAAAQKKVLKALKRAGFQFRDLATTDADTVARARSQRMVSAEAVLFMGGLRHVQDGHPAKALDYFYAVLELNPKNRRAQTLVDIIQTAYIKAISGASTDFPTFATFDPTRILAALDRTIGRIIFHWFAPILLLGLLGFTAYCYGTTTYPDLDVTPFDIALAYAFALLHMFLHELGHGLACYHYGGKVPEIGFTVFYYVVPFPYCDTSSTYLFQKRTHKVAVSLAGNVVTLLLLCFLVISLSVFHPDFFFYRAAYFNMYIAVVALFGNIVPFMKFDGYYALCDLLGTPNLRERSFKLVKSRVSARLLGLAHDEEDLEPRKRRLFFAFGVLSLLWTANWIYQVVFKFTAPVVERFQGAGLVLSMLVLGYLLQRAFVRPCKEAVRLLVRERRRIFTLRRSAVMTVLLAAVVVPWTIEWPILVDSDFVLVPKERRQVRAEVAGVVDHVLVYEGERVRRGQPLVTLRNPELALELRVVTAELEGLDARLEQLRSGARVEEIQLAKSQMRTAQATTLKEAREATMAARLAKAGMGTHARADSTAGSAEVSRSLASAARWRLATLEAGSRDEVIAAAEAERTRLAAQLERATADHELLTIRSPIDGIVITKHLEDRRFARLARGDTYAEIQDVSSFVAEIRMPASAPLGELTVGDEIALRADGFPGREITCRIEQIRSPGAADANAGSRDLIVVTTPFTMSEGRAGMQGHARLYGRRRSVAYAKLYLPLQRVVRVSLWALM